MAKRKQEPDSPDIVSETQKNSRWFLGYRDYQPSMDMTPEEWSRYRRWQRGRWQRIFSAIILVGIAVIFIANLIPNPPSGEVIGILAIAAVALLIAYAILSTRKISRK